jgi:hypothetical protein
MRQYIGINLKMHKSFYPQHSWVLTDEKRKILAVICRRPGGWDKVNIV